MKRTSFVARSIGSIAALGLASAAFSAWTARRVEAEVPPQGRLVDVDGTRLHVVEKGSGPPVVLIHGLGGDLHHFTHSVFARLAGVYHLIAIDRPGAGYSTRRDDEVSRLDQQAQAISTFLAMRSIEKPLIVGHSLGGTIALRLALDHPERAGGLALLAPLTRQSEVPTSFQAIATESSALRWLMAWTLATPMSLLTGKKIVDQAFAPQKPPEDFATRGGGLLALRPAHFYTTSLDLVAVDHDLPVMVKRYAELEIPISVLYGTDDNLLDPGHNLFPLKSKLSSDDIEMVEGAGHMLPLTHPDETADFIRRMAESLPLKA